MARWVYGARGRVPGGVWGRLERVEAPVFCEVARCSSLAAWRVGDRFETAELCRAHTLSTMRSRRVWKGTY